MAVVRCPFWRAQCLNDIAIPKGLYFTAVVVYFFFLSSFLFRRLISAVTERTSIKLEHLFIYDCYLKNLVWTPPGIYPHGLGGKKRFVETDFKLWPNMSLQRNMIWIIYRDSPTSPKFGELWPRNGWERLASFCPSPPPKFSHWETLPALTRGRYIDESRQTLVRVM